MRYLCIAILSFVGVLGVVAEEKTQPASVGKISSVLLEDPQLEQSVSIRKDRIYLGELLDTLSDHVDAPISVSDQFGPMSGYELTVNIHSHPAREVMEGVRRLYNMPPDRWNWMRTKGDHPKYVLRPTLPGTAVREAQSNFSERYLLDEFDKRRRFYALPPNQRAQLAKEDPLLKAANNSRSPGFFSFVSGLSNDELRSVIRGRPLHLPMDRLTSGQRQFIVDEFRRANLLGKPEVKQPNDLQQVTLISTGEDIPTVYLNIGPVGAHGLIGGAWAKMALDRWQDITNQNWVGAGEDRRVPPLPLPVTELDPPLLFDRAIHAYNKGAFQGKEPRALLQLDGKVVTWKRWGDFVLARPLDWPLCDREAAVPWPLRRDLRRASIANGGFLRKQDWVRMSRLEPDQLSTLQEEFADAASVTVIKPLLELWAAMSESEQNAASRAEGAGWADFSQNTRSYLLRSRAPDAARGYHLYMNWDMNARPPRLRYASYSGANSQPAAELRFVSRLDLGR
jgi:hypothetical protein